MNVQKIDHTHIITKVLTIAQAKRDVRWSQSDVLESPKVRTCTRPQEMFTYFELASALLTANDIFSLHMSIKAALKTPRVNSGPIP